MRRRVDDLAIVLLIASGALVAYTAYLAAVRGF